MMSAWIAVIAACFACTGAAWVYFMAYDLRFRLDSLERSVQGMWKRLGNVEQKELSETEDLVRKILSEGQAKNATGPDFGEQLLMYMLQQGATQGTSEPQNRLDEIDGLLYGNGGDPRTDGHRAGENDDRNATDG